MPATGGAEHLHSTNVPRTARIVRRDHARHRRRAAGRNEPVAV